MAFKLPDNLTPGSFDLIATCRRAIRDRIAAIEAGAFKLRIPKVQDRNRMVEGMHFHLMPELFIQLSGISVFRFPQEQFRLYPLDICIVPAGVPHGETAKRYRGPFCNMVVIFSKNAISFHVSSGQPDKPPHVLEIRSFATDTADRVQEYLNDAIETFHNSKRRRRPKLKGIMLANFCYLLDILETKGIPREKGHPKVLHCKQMVAAHLCEDTLSVKQLAKWVNCSADYLSNLFHRQTGRRLTEYLNDERISRATGLLEETSLNISEIAWACGYRDPGYFSRLFRKKTGMSPCGYRKSYQVHMP